MLSCAVVSLPSSAAAQTTVNFVYTANYESSNISGFAVNSSSGALTPINGSPFPSGMFPICVTADPQGKFLYSADFIGHTVSGFRIDPTTGALTPLPGSPFSLGNYPRWVAVDAAGRVLYAANDGDNAVAVASINQATGALTPLNGSPYPSGASPHQIVLHPSGKFAYTPNRQAASLTGYAVNPDGSLSQLPGSPFATGGSEPVGVAIMPDGNYAYVSNRATGELSAFSIDGQTGVPTLLPSSPFPSGPAPFYSSSDPLGTFLFVPHSDHPESGASSVGVYTVHVASGIISQIAESPFPAGVEPLTVAVSPDGRFAYVAAHTSSEVYGFSIDRPAGTLSPLSGSPWLISEGPAVVAFVTVAPPIVAWGDNSYGQLNGTPTTDITTSHDTVGHIVCGSADSLSPFVIAQRLVQLTSLGPARVWTGLKNSDDVGIKFDLRAEVSVNGTLAGSGQLNSVPGGSSGFNNARLNTIPLTLPAPLNVEPGSTLALKMSVRNACSGSGKNSGTARIWFGDASANSRFDAMIASSSGTYYPITGSALSTSAGSSRKFLDTAAGAKCSPYKPFGSWSITLP